MKTPIANRLLALVVLLIFVGGVILLAKRNTSLEQTTKLQVTTSFYPMYFFAQQIGGDKAQVYNITPASSEPHDYEPTTQDVVRIETSDLLILNGGALEPWGDKITNDLRSTKPFVVVAGNTIANKMMSENNQTIRDPHVWLSPPLAKIEVNNIEKGYEHADPQHKAYYQKNTKRLDQQLDELDKAYKEGLRMCTLSDFVTSHAAFAYLAQQYHLNQIAISGISPDEEPSSQNLAEITKLVQKENIPVIFFESLVSPKLSDTIAQETGARTLVLDPLEGIPQDQIEKGANYFSIMHQNLANLEVALGCKK